MAHDPAAHSARDVTLIDVVCRLRRPQRARARGRRKITCLTKGLYSCPCAAGRRLRIYRRCSTPICVRTGSFVSASQDGDRFRERSADVGGGGRCRGRKSPRGPGGSQARARRARRERIRFQPKHMRRAGRRPRRKQCESFAASAVLCDRRGGGERRRRASCDS